MRLIHMQQLMMKGPKALAAPFLLPVLLFFSRYYSHGYINKHQEEKQEKQQ